MIATIQKKDNIPFWLHKEESAAFFVLEGTINIYHSMIGADGTPYGSRTFLFQMLEGELLFSVEPFERKDGIYAGLLAVPVCDIELNQAKTSLSDAMRSFVEEWVEKCCWRLGYSRERIEEAYQRLDQIGIEGFNSSIMRLLDEQVKEETRQIITANRRRYVGENSYMQAAINNLRSVVPSAKAQDSAVEADCDPIIAACSAVAKEKCMDITIPRAVREGKAYGDVIGDIALASRFKTREVVLSGEWYLQENGSLLAKLEESGEPIALIQKKTNKYVMYNPATGERVKVIKKNAAAINPKAVMFYRSLPAHSLTGKDILRFVLKGTGKTDWIWVIIMGLCGGLLGMLSPIITGTIFDTVIPDGNRGLLIQIGFLMGAMALTTFAFEITRAFAMHRISGAVERDLQPAVWDRILSLPTGFFKKYTAGELMERAMSISQIQQILSGAVTNTIITSMFSVFYIIVMFSKGAKLAWFGLGIAFVALVISLNELLLGGADIQPDIQVNQNDLAYCIYTSGTTGQPKGVLLTHKGIVNIANPRNNPFNEDVCETGTGIVAIGSICFDISLFEIFVFLLNGKFVAIATDDELANGEAIAELYKKTGANVLHCTPSRLHNYISGSLFADVLKRQIKIILSAGEVLPTHLAAMITSYNINIYNGYGPTETTIGATITEAGDRETIGKPIANATVYIVDANKALLPFGVIGEIAVAGDGVGLGYIGRDKLTMEKFTVINNEKAYLTGDMGFFSPDGQLKYVARNDSQIKLRGYRIEISEIEQCALEHRGVENCAAIIKEINGENHLILYYSGKEEYSEKLKEHLRKFLSYYMVPHSIIRLLSLPTNVNGKTDRAALANLPVSVEIEYTPPSTKEEEILCEAFETVLSLQRVGIDDNFFEIGGTSLLAAKMMMYANKYDLDVEYSAIFKYPTPRLIAENIGERKFHNYLLTLISTNKREFEKIDELLRQRHSDDFSANPLGNVLVTGATGFLGSHIVKSLFDDSSIEKIYCLVRSKGKLAPENRLKTTLFFYFNDFSEEQFARKIHVIDGDITDKSIILSISDEITTVINCAANVAHFAYGDSMKTVNVNAVENLIDFCTARNAALIHVSTTSVAGHYLKENTSDTAYMESSLYKGQIISNEYVYSKFLAEFLILQAKTNGLRAKIMRVGNLQGRKEDGEFQINLQKNAFTRTIKAYAVTGCAPNSLKKKTVDITPVDEAAKAILLLSGLPDCYTIFHVMNAIPTSYDEVFSMFSSIGKEIRYMENGGFEALVNELAKDSTEAKSIEGLFLSKSDIRLRENPIDAGFTVRALNNLGFEYKEIEKDYIEKYLHQLNGLGFFD